MSTRRSERNKVNKENKDEELIPKRLYDKVSQYDNHITYIGQKQQSPKRDLIRRNDKLKSEIELEVLG